MAAPKATAQTRQTMQRFLPLGLVWMARTALLAAVFITAYEAFAPHNKVVALLPWDKAEHFVSFFILTILSVLAFYRAPMWSVALGISLLGAVIELVQGTPWVGRDCDLFDWLAEDVAIGAVFSGVVLGKLRTLLVRDGLFSRTRSATSGWAAKEALTRPDHPTNAAESVALRQEVETLRQLLREAYTDAS